MFWMVARELQGDRFTDPSYVVVVVVVITYNNNCILFLFK